MWVKPGQMLNTLLIEKGYARPDERLFLRYDKEYRQALEQCEEARKKEVKGEAEAPSER
jgi:endonuclease YncB( thermonuclease family)